MENPYKMLESHIGEIMTYPALCKLISEDVKSGKGRELHLKKIAQYVHIDRESVPRKLIVREVYLPESFKLNKPRGKIYPYMKDIFLELFQKKKTVNATVPDLLRTLNVVSKEYLTDAYSVNVTALKFRWHPNKKFEDWIDAEAISELILEEFFRTTRTVINESIRSTLRQLERKGLIGLESSLCLMRHVTKTIDGRKQTIVEKHFLSSEEQKNYLALLKEIEKEYKIDCKRLFFSKQIDENRDKAKKFLSEKAKMLSPENGEYKFYSTSYRIKITERGMNEKLGNIEQSTKTLATAIRTSVLDKCYDDLHKAIPEPLLNRFFEKYFNIHLTSMI